MDIRWLIKSILVLVFGSSAILALGIVLLQDLLVCPAVLHRYLSGRPAVPELPPGVKRHWIRSADGTKLDLWSHEVEGTSKPPILYLHGNGEWARSILGLYGRFAAAGYSVFELDYRGFGQSEGWPTEAGLTMDAEAALDFVAARTKFEKSKVILLGNSLGTGFASSLAANHQSEHLLLVAPYRNLKTVAAFRPIYRFFVGLMRWNVPQEDFIASLSGTEVTAVHGVLDTVIPIGQSIALREAFRGTGTFTLSQLDGVSHNDALDAAIPIFISALED